MGRASEGWACSSFSAGDTTTGEPLEGLQGRVLGGGLCWRHLAGLTVARRTHRALTLLPNEVLEHTVSHRNAPGDRRVSITQPQSGVSFCNPVCHVIFFKEMRVVQTLLLLSTDSTQQGD